MPQEKKEKDRHNPSDDDYAVAREAAGNSYNENKGTAYAALDAVSVVDPIGVSDGLNGTLYALEGNRAAAIESYKGMVLGELGKRLAKAKDARRTLGIADDVGEQAGKRGIADFPDRPPASPAIDGSPYSPREVSKRQSELRRQLGTGNLDPDSPIPTQRPGRDLGGHPSTRQPRHTTGERNVSSAEEHSRVPKRPDNRGGGQQ